MVGGHIFDHIQGHVKGVFRPGVVPTGTVITPTPSFDPASLFVGGYAGGAWAMTAANLRQSSAGTGAVVNGDPVGYVMDLSGNGKHLTQATSGKRPTYVESGGVCYLDFDGVDDTMAVALDFSADNKCTIVIAWRTVDAGGVRVPLDYGYGLSPVNGTWTWYTQPFGTDAVHARVYGNANAGVVELTPSDRLNRHVDSLVIDFSQAMNSNKAVAVRDGATDFTFGGSGFLGTANLASKTIKLCDDAGTGFSLAEFSALLVIGRVLTAEELAQVRTWAGAYAGVTI